MRTLPRFLLPIGVGLVAVVIGLFAGRLIRGGEDSADAPSTANVVVADDAARRLLEPDFVGSGTTDGTDDATESTAAVPASTGAPLLSDDAGAVTATDALGPPERVVPLLSPVASVDEGTDLSAPTAIPTPSQAVASDSALAPATPDDAVASFALDYPSGGVVGITPAGDGPAPDVVETDAAIVELTNPPVLPPDETPDSVDDAGESDEPDPEPEPVSFDVAEIGVPLSETGADPDADAGEPGSVPLVVMPDLGISIALDPIVFDPCAGPVVGDGDGTCGDEGWAGTLFALSTPPELELFGTAGHADRPQVDGGQVCPSTSPEPTASRRPMTIWSTAPLVSATLTARPVGTDAEPVEVVVATASDQVDDWNARFEAADEYDRAWGLIPTCVVVDVGNADTTYDVTGFGVDTFNRLGNITPVVLRTDAAGRPPTETRIEGVSPVAHVRAWTTAEGSVVFRARTIPDGTSASDAAECPTAGQVAERNVFPSNRPNPDIYDADFSHSYFTKIPFMTGGRLLVCVEIYDTDNPLQPLVIERHLFEGGLQPRPIVELRSIDTRGDGDATDEFVIGTGSAAFGAASVGCDKLVNVPAVDDDTLATFGTALWECSGPQTSLTPTGTFDLPIQFERDGITIVDAAIPIDANDCRTERCPQRTDYFRVPIVAPGELVCFRGIREVCPGDPDVQATALITVRYPLVTASGGLSDRITALDDVDVTVLDEQPRITRPTMTVRRAAELARWDATFSFQSDRPLRVSVEAFELPTGDRCYRGEATTTTDVLDDEFSITVPGLCAGRSYGVWVHLTDEAGRTWRIDPGGGYVTPQPPKALFDIQLDFVASSGAPEAVHIGQFEARLNGARTGGSALAYELPSSGPVSAPTCFEVASPSEPYLDDSTTIEGRARGVQLEAAIPVRFVGGSDTCERVARDWQLYWNCSRLSRSSDEWLINCQGSPHARGDAADVLVEPIVWRFSAGFTYDDLEAAGTAQPLVVTTEPNADGVAMRFTIQRLRSWSHPAG